VFFIKVTILSILSKESEMLDVGDFQLLSKSSKSLHTACARGFSSRREGYKCKNISQNISFIFGLAQSRTKF